MKALAMIAVLGLAVSGGDEHEKALALLKQGKAAEAAAAFQAAIDRGGPTPELCYDLALAQWRAGKLDEAEVAAEKAATLSDGRLDSLRDGLLGNLRYTAAKAKESKDLQGALKLAEQARDHFLQGATAPDATPEIARNLERSLQLIEEIHKKIEEQKKKQKDKKGDDKNKKKDGKNKDEDKNKAGQPKKDDDKKQDEQKKQDEDNKKASQPKKDDKKNDDTSKAEQHKAQDQQEPEEGKQPQPEPGKEQKAKPPEKKQAPAPGEQGEGKELTPEQKMRLLQKLKQLDEKRRELRMQQKARRPKVKKDW